MRIELNPLYEPVEIPIGGSVLRFEGDFRDSTLERASAEIRRAEGKVADIKQRIERTGDETEKDAEEAAACLRPLIGIILGETAADEICEAAACGRTVVERDKLFTLMLVWAGLVEEIHKRTKPLREVRMAEYLND